MKKRNITWDSAKNTADNARVILPDLVQEFFSAGRKALKKTKKLRGLHRFRIRTKGFRYALEIFQPLYGPAMETRLESLRQIQQHLGDINDCSSIRRILDTTLLGDGFLATQLNNILDADEKQRIRKLTAYWKDTLDAPGEEEKWMRYLRDYAGRTKPRTGA